MSRVKLPTGRVVDVHEANGQVDFLGTDATVDVVDLIALAAMFQACAYPVSRESGGSIPPERVKAAAGSVEGPAAGKAYPPVLNKSGGSHVHRAVPGPGTTSGRELCADCGEWFSNL